jgi:hypothetical protein
MTNGNAMSAYCPHAATFLLMFAVLPVWIFAGLADYFCHRASGIETTSGTKESLLHLLQFSIIGLPVMMVLFLEVNAGVFAVAGFCILLHHAVAYWDVSYANDTRNVSPLEQMVHSFLEIVPIAAFFLLAVLYWPQVVALFGVGHDKARFILTLKGVPLPPPYILVALGAAAVLNAGPYLEELARCQRKAKLHSRAAGNSRG